MTGDRVRTDRLPGLLRIASLLGSLTVCSALLAGCNAERGKAERRSSQTFPRRASAPDTCYGIHPESSLPSVDLGSKQQTDKRFKGWADS